MTANRARDTETDDSTAPPDPKDYSFIVPVLASLIIPGAGQVIQGRTYMGILYFALALALWWLLMGWLVHIWAAGDAYFLGSLEETATEEEAERDIEEDRTR